MKSTPLAPVGSPPRVTITKVVRTQYRLEWEYDGERVDFDESGPADTYPVRKRAVRHVNRAATAYRMAALRLIFSRRDRYAHGEAAYANGRRSCSLCEKAPGEPEEQPLCRYHGGDGFDVLVARLARWLRWRDSVLAAREAFRAKSRAWFRRTAA